MLGLFEKCHILTKNCCVYFGLTFGQNWGIFIQTSGHTDTDQHTPTLVCKRNLATLQTHSYTLV